MPWLSSGFVIRLLAFALLFAFAAVRTFAFTCLWLSPGFVPLPFRSPLPFSIRSHYAPLVVTRPRAFALPFIFTFTLVQGYIDYQ
jgi:hypothetical protein